MRTYETIFIVHPEVAGEELDALIDKYRQVLADQGADILKVDNWGNRTLAYPVKKQARGSYIFMVFDGMSSIIAEYERRMRIDEKVIKFQTVLLEGGYQAPKAVEPESVNADAEEETESETGEESADA